MSAGQGIYDAGEEMAPYYDGVIKGCAVAIAPPAVVFGPAVQSLAAGVYTNQCNPGDVMKAGGAWIMLAEKNTEAAEALQAEIDAVTPEHWSGDDADAFAEAAGNVKRQLQELAATALLIGAQLVAFAVTLTVYWLFLTACAAAMDAHLTAYLAALAGASTASGAPAIMAGARTVADSLAATVKRFESALASLASDCAALTGGFTAFTFGFQKGAGDPVDIAGADVADTLEGFAAYGLDALMTTSGGRHAAVSPGLHALQGSERGSGFGGPGLGAVGGLRDLWEGNIPDPEEAQGR
ncbi:hypothetical protein LO763_01535 [Glycomyces sp. A-F 0318]|uniref:PPE domain-containing protein n=1 Tax=Glycomyces amatae TaxID=2881355 RepID=UPI001E5AD880|nr:PPE domain-containing protein [Glycomyces amatae]MCD0442307.1 hypothetical protein [Glycomyces amatae]